MEAECHPALWSPPEITASWNLGGERLWIGPESDWFWKKAGTVDFAHYQVPPGLDPDEWEVTEAGPSACESRLDLDLRCQHAGRRIRLAIRRRFDLLDGASLARPAAAGLVSTTTMEILDGTPGQPVDLWSILQVPFGGRMIAPALGLPAPRDYFEPCPAGEIELSAGLFSLRIGGPTMFKIGLGPAQATGRIAYVRPVGGRWLVLQRSSPVHPALPYCDAPPGAVGTPGDAVQFFNDGGNFGCFGEMEHRSPAIVCGAGPQSVTESAATTVSLLDESGFASWKAAFLQTSECDKP
jgi:hypothetical protein